MSDVASDQEDKSLDKLDPLSITDTDVERFLAAKKPKNSSKRKRLEAKTTNNQEISKKQKTDIEEKQTNKNKSDEEEQTSPLLVISHVESLNEQTKPEDPVVEERSSGDEQTSDTPHENLESATLEELPGTSGSDFKFKNDEDFNITEKLKEMAEISVKPVSKSEIEQQNKKVDQPEDNVSLELKKGDRKGVNFRKNIKDLLDETQLDASTLAAQRLESERLARVQEQQRLIRDVQRQLAAEKQANKAEARVMSILQGHTTIKSLASTTISKASDSLLLKNQINQSNFLEGTSLLTPSVSITPTSKSPAALFREQLLHDETLEDSEDDEPPAQIQKQPVPQKKAVVMTIDSSSDSDDCIILSDDEEAEDPEDADPHNSGLHVNDAYNKCDSEGRVIINIGHGANEPDIYLAPQIARVIKPHQIGGVRFLFDNIIESVDRFDSSTGFGCILAHSMGLGKTVQLVCFCDIFLRHTSSKTVLIIMPINTLQNWINEFNMWTPSEEDKDKSNLNETGEVRPRTFKIHVLNDSHKTLNSRAKVILEWLKDGGVLMMGYEIYRLLSQKKLARPKKKRSKDIQAPEKTNTVEQQDMFDKIYSALVKPGPDLVVCDEGHRIKNAHASTSLALKQIKTKRRVVLTGYPLQNNLLEYWCMVDFVRPNYLGTKTEFSNMFERPIQNGQCIDSTPQDCKTMRYRAHVLHSLLLGFVQRRSHMVLQACLPQKQEYVLLVRTTPFQRKLYNVFMNDVIRTKTVPNPLKAFSVCCKIWNHPDVLYNFLKKREIDLEIEIDEIMNKDTPAAENGSKTTPKKRGRKKNEAKDTKETKANKNGKESKEEKTPSTSLLKSDESSSSSLTAMSSHSSSAMAKVEVKEEDQKVKIENNGNSLNPPENSYNMTNPSTSFQDQQGFGYNSNFNNYGNSSYPNQNQQDPMGFYDQNSANFQGFDNYGSNGSNNYWQNNYYPPQSTEFPPPTQQNNYYQNNYQPYQDQPTNNFTQPFQPEDVKDVKIEPKDVKPKIEELEDLKEKEDVKKDKEVKQQLKELLEKKESQKLDKAEIDEKRKEIMLMKSMKEDGNIPYDWAVTLMKDYVQDILENSPKLELFFCILNESIKMDDRVLVFSQSLLTLNIMERFLQRSKIPGKEFNWSKNQSYFRLDGSTGACEREKLINEFNSNSNVKLFLVSTRAGSLGINLVGANRVIVFDASWNPCHDTQAVCRVYRYGQQKPCFIYRLVMDNCLEKKIYDRQINKQGMADRVVDECNPDAHLSMREVTSLCWNDGDETEIKDYSDKIDDHSDLIMKEILGHHSQCLTKEPFQHESLLVDRKEKKLSVAEKRLAKRGYELEKQAANKPAGFSYNSVGTNYRAFRGPDGVLMHRPVASVRPMQNDLGDGINSIRSNNARPNRWIPAEVWQRQGMTAQEMTLPLDVTIPTSSADKSNIVLKAGQKVMVLKSPKGIYMQLETGKIIAIRTSVKMGHGAQGSHPSATHGGAPTRPEHPNAFSKSGPMPPMKPTFTSLQESAQSNNIPASARNHSLIKTAKLNAPGRSNHPLGLPPNRSHPQLALHNRAKPFVNVAPKSKPIDDDVINISNDEDDEEPQKDAAQQNGASSSALTEPSPPPAVSKSPEVEKVDEQQFKEKVVYKPNLVGRKPRLNSGSQSSAPIQAAVHPIQTNFKPPPDFPNLDRSNKNFGKMVDQAPLETNYEQSVDSKPPPQNPHSSGHDDYQFYPQHRGAQGNFYNSNTYNQQPRYDNQYDEGYGHPKPSGGFPGPAFTDPPPIESSVIPKQEHNLGANDSLEQQSNPLPNPSAPLYPRERESGVDSAFRPPDNPAGYEPSAAPFMPFQHYPNPSYPQYPQNAANPTYLPNPPVPVQSQPSPYDYPYQNYNSGYPPVAAPSNAYPYPAANYPPIESQQYQPYQPPYGAPPINPAAPNYNPQAYPPAEQPPTSLPSFGQWNYNN